MSPDKRGDAVLGVQAGLQHRIDLGSGEVAGGTAVEDYIEGTERALGLPELIRHDADGIVAQRIPQPRMLDTRVFVGDGEGGQLHHRAHAGHFEDPSCPYESFSPRVLMTKPFSVRHCATSIVQVSAAARTRTSRAAAPAVRNRSYSAVVDIEAPSFCAGGSCRNAIL